MTRRNPKPSRSNSDTVVMGDKSFAALAAEFADLSNTAGTQPPKGSASPPQLAKIWNISEGHTQRRIRDLVASGELRCVGRFLVSVFGRRKYPVAHYVRVR